MGLLAIGLYLCLFVFVFGGFIVVCLLCVDLMLCVWFAGYGVF